MVREFSVCRSVAILFASVRIVDSRLIFFSTTTDKGYDFDAVTGGELRLGMLSAWHEVQVPFDRQSPWIEFQLGQQVSDCRAFGDFAFLAING
jgi:hypothetical protein